LPFTLLLVIFILKAPLPVISRVGSGAPKSPASTPFVAFDAAAKHVTSGPFPRKGLGEALRIGPKNLLFQSDRLTLPRGKRTADSSQPNSPMSFRAERSGVEKSPTSMQPTTYDAATKHVTSGPFHEKQPEYCGEAATTTL